MADACAPTVLFLGMTGAFSLPPLEALLRAGLAPVAVVLPRSAAPGQRREGGLNVLNPYVQRTIVQVAWEHGIPVHDFAAIEALDLRADVLAVACFDRLISRAVRVRAKLAVNVHPSLLPQNRGPAPLFWTFRLGLQTTGVTIHVLEDRVDAGAILAQQEVPVPGGIDGAELEQQLANLGGELLVEVIRKFQQGQLRPVAQDEARASSHPWPSQADWEIPAGWPAQRALHFRRGVAHMRMDATNTAPGTS